jgi:hypothetical protein
MVDIVHEKCVLERVFQKENVDGLTFILWFRLPKVQQLRLLLEHMFTPSLIERDNLLQMLFGLEHHPHY